MNMSKDVKARWDQVVSKLDLEISDLVRLCDDCLELDLYFDDFFAVAGPLSAAATRLLPDSLEEQITQEFLDCLWDFISHPELEIDSEYLWSRLKGMESWNYRPGGFGELAANVLRSNVNMPEEWLLAAGEYMLRYTSDQLLDFNRLFEASKMTPAIALELMSSKAWDPYDYDVVPMFVGYVNEQTLMLPDDDPLVVQLNNILRSSYLETATPDLLAHMWETLYPVYKRMPADDISLCAHILDTRDSNGYEDQSSLADMLVCQQCCPPDVLALIANWPDCEEAHIVISERLDISPNICETLAYSEHDSVRSRIAEHPNLPLPIINLLSRDQYASIRQGVAINPSTPLPIITLLTSDEDESVALSAKESLNSRSKSTVTWLMGNV